MSRSETPFIDLVQEAWPFFQSNLPVTLGVPAFLIGVPLLVVVLPVCIVAVIAGVVAGFVLGKGSVLITTVVIGVIIGVPLFMAAFGAVRVGWTNIMLKLLRGEHCIFMDIKSGMPWFMNFVLTMFLIGIGTAIASIFFLVPGILFAVRTSFAPFLVVDKNLGPIEALLKSNELVTGYSWQIFGYLVLYGLANAVSGIIPIANFVLPVASMGFFDLVLARLYLYRCNESAKLSHA